MLPSKGEKAEIRRKKKRLFVFDGGWLDRRVGQTSKVVCMYDGWRKA